MKPAESAHMSSLSLSSYAKEEMNSYNFSSEPISIPNVLPPVYGAERILTDDAAYPRADRLHKVQAK